MKRSLYGTYAFCVEQSCAVGASPNGSLIDMKGTLFGTTSEGAH
jgi:hypothetical protein